MDLPGGLIKNKGMNAGLSGPGIAAEIEGKVLRCHAFFLIYAASGRLDQAPFAQSDLPLA
jgi:hypothetical protein